MNLEIANPYQENNNYIFTIKSNTETLIYEPKRTHNLHKYENKMSLSICDKQDLQFFDSLRNDLIRLMHDQQENWFEDKFTVEDLESMFYEYLRPNFRENSIDLQCLFSDEFHAKLGNENESSFSLQIYPRFSIQSIKFDGKKFYIMVDCNDFEYVGEKNTKNDEEQPVEESQDVDDEVSLEREFEEDNEEKSGTQDELEEVELNKENLENMDMSLSEDDYYIVYKTINQEIKNNIVDSLHKIFESKGINVGDLNLSDIVYDSDSDSDSDSDDSENDFEENYKDMIS